MSESTTDTTPKHWITTASPTIEAVVNPLIAACSMADYTPSYVRLLDNPDIEEESKHAATIIKEVIAAHDGPEPTVESVTIQSERDFEAIVEYHREAIEAARKQNAEVAIDVTPGRKFMSAIAFQAGIQFGADHVYYLYLHSSDYYDRVYPEIPRPGIDLVDFEGVF